MTSRSSASSELSFECPTLVGLLRWRALHQPDRKAYIFLSDGETVEAALTYGELDRQARAIGASLQRSGATGTRALLLYPSGLEYIAAFFGCLYAGVVAVPVYPPQRKRLLSRLQAIVGDAQAKMALTSAAILSTAPALLAQTAGLDSLQWLTTHNIAHDVGKEWRDPEIDGNTLALLQYTSGSTTVPRGVMVSHGNLLHDQRMIQETFRQTAQSIIMGWLPLYHDMGLIGNILQPLYVGAPCVLMSPAAFLHSPFRWLQAISRYQATTSGGPNFAYDLCVRKITPEQCARLDLRRWRVAFNGAEPVRSETLDRFAATFAPCGFRREAFHPCYGLAEATLIVSGGRAGIQPLVKTVQAQGLENNLVIGSAADGDKTRSLVSCGRILLDEKIIIVDPKSLTKCLPDEVGEIWVSGPGIAHGYWNRPQETEETFRARLSDTEEGPFLRTGDLGFLCKEELFVTGRLKDLIILRGRNHYPQDIERTVAQSHPALRPGSTAAFSVQVGGEEELVIVQELDYHQHPDANGIMEAIRQALGEEHEIQAHALVLINPGSLPKTSSGKVQRQACRAGFLEGTLKIIKDWRETAISESPAPVLPSPASIEDKEGLEAWLVSQLAAKLGMPAAQIDLHQPIVRYGVDSLRAAELMHAIEITLDVHLPMASLLETPSIAQLAAQLLAQLKDQKCRPIALVPTREALAGRYSLSFAQQRIWFLDQLEPGHPFYNCPVMAHLTGRLNLAAWRQSFAAIVSRHEVLRTTFSAVEGRPAQVAVSTLTLAMPMVDLRALPATKQAAEVRRLAAEEAQRRFQLSRGPLLRITLLWLNKAEHVLLLTIHHIVCDGWSLGIFLQELATLYEAFCTGKPCPLPKPPTQYKDFVYWERQRLQGEVLEAHLSYWKRKLDGASTALMLPTDRPRPSVPTFQGACHPVVVPKALVESIKALSYDRKATPFMLMVAALKILLFKWTDQTDIVIGTVVAHRSSAATTSLIGCFMNFLPLRSKVSGDLTGQQLLEQIKITLLEAYSHEDCPFEKLVEVINPDRKLNQSALFNVAFLMQNYPRPLFFSDTLEARFVPQFTGSSLLDMRIIAEESAEGMLLQWEYDTDLFDADTIAQLVASYRTILEKFVQSPETRVSHFRLSDGPEVRAQTAQGHEVKPTIAITSTFTAEPIKESLLFWMQELGIPARIEFAPYNQVFQQLLDSASLLSKNQDGVNIILVQLEDWQERKNEAAQAGSASAATVDDNIERNVRDFLFTLKSATGRSATPHLVCFCPASPAVLADAERAASLHRMEEEIISELGAINNVYVVTRSELAITYPISTYYDPHASELGHIPFTPLFFTALGTMIARKIYALKSVPRKVIVLDCDQTLWKGICGEEGPLGIEVDPPRKTLQEFMVAQQSAGMLLGLCSKNNEEDVIKVFQHHPEMPLQRTHIAAWRINWGSKSENIASLAAELQLGLESFIFIEDDPLECAEVKANCPEVLTFLLPQDPGKIPLFLHHLWVFDRLRVTGEDRRRTALYKQNLQRESFRKGSRTLADFLAGLELEIQISKMASAPQWSRVSQLTQRTNQFNFSGIRRSESEISKLRRSGKLECLGVEVKDRFGDYGLVGVMIFAIGTNAINVDTLLLSCRVLGRGVEHRMLACLGELAKARSLGHVAITYTPTRQNKPALAFLDGVGEQFKRAWGDGYLFTFPAAFAAGLTYAPSSDRPARAGDAGLKDAAPARTARTGTLSHEETAKLYRIATELYYPEQILKAIHAQRRDRPELKTPFVAPRTPIEKELAAIWAELLGLEQVGLYDSFFDLGGHSLLAVQLNSRVLQTFHVEETLKVLFAGTPTIAELAKIIRQRQIERIDATEVATMLEDLDALSDEEVKRLLAHEGRLVGDQEQNGRVERPLGR